MRRPNARKRVLILTTSLMALMATGASAQNTDPVLAGEEEDIETVVVTGIRRGIQDSIDLKRRSTSIVEAVSAEDIGKLPDVSIAESLSRLPGLAGQRVNGRAQVISIRGLSPDFSTTLLNGRMQVSSGDNRAAEFDQYPSELVSSAVVYKTPDASLVGQGLSGTVNLTTLRPLDLKERVISVGVRGSHNDAGKLNSDSDTWGNRVNLTYVDQFFDGKLGIALAYAHLDDPTQTKHSKRWWWDKQGDLPKTDPSDPDIPRFGIGHGDAMGLHGVEIWANSREQIRDGYMAVIEFKPNDNFHSINDLYYSKFEQKETIRGAMWNQTRWNDDVRFADSTFETVGGSEIWTGGKVIGVVPILRNDYNEREDTLISIGSQNRFNLGAWRGLFDLGWSKAKREEAVSETYAGYGADPTPLSRVFDTIDERVGFGGIPTLTPGLDYGDAANVWLGDVAPGGSGWNHDGTLRYPEVEDELKTARLSFSRDLAFGPFVAFDAGIDYSNRTKSKAVDEYNLCLKGWVDDGSGNCHGLRVPVAASYLVGSTDLGWAGFGQMLSYNVPSVIGSYYDRLPIKDENNYNKFWGVEETLQTGLARLDINTQAFNIPIRGNLGVQVVRAEQSSSGYLTRPGTPVTFEWFEVSQSYTDVLPSLNLIFDVTDKDIIRFGAGKAMARPRMDELRANVSAGVDTTTGLWSGNGGNPNLRPWRATAYDISYEHYFSRVSYIGIAYYYKELKSYIRTLTDENFDFSGYPNLSGVPAVSPIGTMRTPVNGSGGKVDGVEFSLALEGGLLHRWLDGFGLLGSLSRGWTNIAAGDPTDPAKLPGMSGEVRNFTLYYEKHGFSARISQRYRSPQLGETTQLYANRAATRIMEDEQVDAQITYDIQTGPLKGMTLLVQAYNVTNEPYQTELKISENRLADGTSFPETYETYGRTILFGFNYKFK